MFIEITDSAIAGNDAQAPAGSEISGSGVYASFGANLTLENVDISDNKEVLGGADSVVDGYTCEGIATAEGNCVAPQRGDANRDGKVDMDDFLALSAAFGQEGDWLNGDFDRDGTVGFNDFLLLALNFGESNG